MTNPDAGQQPSAEPDSSASQPTPGGHEAPPIEQSDSFPGPVLDFPTGPVPPIPPTPEPYRFGPPPQFAPAEPPPFGPPYGPPPYGPPPFGPSPQFGPPPGYPAPPMQSPLYPTDAPTNGMAIGSLVTSLVAVPFAFLCYGVVGIPASIVGIVLGIVSLNQLKVRPQKGREMALAGIVAGGIALLLSIVMIVLTAVFLSHLNTHGLTPDEV